MQSDHADIGTAEESIGLSGKGASRMASLLRGSAWTLASFILSQAIRFAANLFLTRLLAPDLMGLVALMTTFLVGLALFSDVGIGPSIIRRGTDDVDFLNTAWTVQITRGVMIWIVCILAAYPISIVYEEPRIVWLLPLVGLNTLINSLNATSLYTLNRDLRMKQLILIELTTQTVSTTVMVVWAFLDRSILALVAGGLVASVFQMAASHRLQTFRQRLRWDPSAVRELVHFGRWIFITTALAFLSSQLDRILIGKLFSIEVLGVYGVAAVLSDMPRSAFQAVLGRLLLPTLARDAHLPAHEFRSRIRSLRTPILLLAAPMVAILVGFGDVLVRVLYDQRYQQGAWMLPILSLGIWPMILTQSIDPALYAIGRPRGVATGCAVSFVVLFVGIVAGDLTVGLVGAVVAVSASNVAQYLVTNYSLHRERLALWADDLGFTLLLLACVLAAHWAKDLLPYGRP